MNYNQLKTIDFSQGIRSSEVMHNDRALQEQIERERLAIAGYGVNFGLDLSLTKEFELSVTQGTIVDKNGVEQFIDSKVFQIEKPNLIMRSQRLFSTENGVITLEDIPYAETRTEPSQFTSDRKNWGISVYYEDEPGRELSISAIKGTTIYTDSRYNNRAILVNYYAAYDRIDTVYINNDYRLVIGPGIDSTTPSAYIPEDCKYVLGFIKVISKFYDEDKEHEIAKCSIIKEFNNRRTVYTDLNNNLYLCGVPFESLLRIYFEEPKDPKEGMLWYDMDTNKLKIWRRTDNFMFTDIVTYTSVNPNDLQKFKTSVGYRKNQLSVYIETRANGGNKVWTKLTDAQIEVYTDLKDSDKDKLESKEFRIIPKLVTNTNVKYTINRYDGSYYWVPINDTANIAVKETKMWASNLANTNLVEYKPGLNIGDMKEERKNHDLRQFLFHADELHLRFTPYKNELSLMIDQIPLHRDQFNEITVEDVLNDTNLTNLAITYYGYTTALLQNLKEVYKELGIGFKFTNALDKPAFIEVNVEHRVNDSMLKNKFQRSATFAKTETIIYNNNADTVTYAENTTGDIKVSTSVPFMYGEEQLDVFVNGVRVKKEYITEVTVGEAILGATCKQFILNGKAIGIANGAEITYKILTNVYTYDHVESIIRDTHQELLNKIADLEAKLNALSTKVDNFIG